MEFTLQVVFSVIMALLISLVTFTAKVQKGEKFELVKLIRTALIGLALGVVAAFSGFDLTAENWEMYAAANVGAVAFVDKVLIAVLRLLGRTLPYAGSV